MARAEVAALESKRFWRHFFLSIKLQSRLILDTIFDRSDRDRKAASNANPPSGRSAKQRIISPVRGLKK
jgi:hypothetical protein